MANPQSENSHNDIVHGTIEVSNETYVPLSRGIRDHLIRMTGNEVKLYLYLLINARFNGPKKGQVTGTFAEISESLGWHYETTRKTMRSLIKQKYIYFLKKAINQHSTNLIFIHKYKALSDFAPVHKYGGKTEGNVKNESGKAFGEQQEKIDAPVQKAGSKTLGALSKNGAVPKIVRSEYGASTERVRSDAPEAMGDKGFQTLNNVNNVNNVIKKKTIVKEKVKNKKIKSLGLKDFSISPEMEKWLNKQNLEFNPQEEIPKFIDYHLAKGSKFKDFNAAFRNWIRKAIEIYKRKEEQYGTRGRISPGVPGKTQDPSYRKTREDITGGKFRDFFINPESKKTE